MFLGDLTSRVDFARNLSKRAYIYYGGSSMDNTVDEILTMTAGMNL
jgi:hypothetical protein